MPISSQKWKLVREESCQKFANFLHSERAASPSGNSAPCVIEVPQLCAQIDDWSLAQFQAETADRGLLTAPSSASTPEFTPVRSKQQLAST